MIAIVFPGQGSQTPHMGDDFYNQYSEYKKVLDEKIPDILKIKDTDEIHKTINAQPLLLANQIGILEVIKSRYNLDVDATAGFSLGEFTSYYMAQVLSYDDVFDIVKTRARLMDKINSSVELRVVMGLTLDNLINLQKDYDFLISNVNLDKQILVGSSDWDSLEVVLKENKAKRILPLNLSGPFHTKEFDEIACEFKNSISQTFKKPSIDLYLNVTGDKYQDQDFKDVVEKQMKQSVLWYKQINSMIDDGITTFIEVGSNPVVSNMIKKISKEVKIITISKVEDLSKLEELCKK